MTLVAPALVLALSGSCRGAADVAMPAGPAPAGQGPGEAVLGLAEEPWSHHPRSAIVAMVSPILEADAVERIKAILEERQARGRVEGLRIAGERTELTGALAAGCRSEVAREHFSRFVGLQRASLDEERGALGNILDIVGPVGRGQVWDLASPERVILAPEVRLIETFAAGMDLGQGGADPDGAMEMRRTQLDLRVLARSSALRAEAAVAEASASIARLDPASDETPRAAVALVLEVDEALIAAQGRKFDMVLDLCAREPRGTWLSLLEAGTIDDVLGTLGGAAGAEPAGEWASDMPPPQGGREPGAGMPGRPPPPPPGGAYPMHSPQGIAPEGPGPPQQRQAADQHRWWQQPGGQPPPDGGQGR